jgi:ELWxxDGT repeat protein
MRRRPRRFGAETLESRTMLSVSLVKDINTAPTTGFSNDNASFNGAFYFTTFDTASGVELWKSDGTPAGPSLVRDVLPGPRASSRKKPTVVNGALLF